MAVWSEVKSKSCIEFKRFDADFYRPEYLNIQQILRNSPMLAEITDTFELHSNGAFEDIFNILHKSKELDVPYIRSENVGDFFIEGKVTYISNYAHRHLKKTITKFGDVLTARTGKVGGASIVKNEWVDCNSNQNVVNIRVKNIEYIKPQYLVTFLNTKYGISQFKRASTGNVQPWLNLSLLRKVHIYVPLNEIQDRICYIIDKAYELKNLSKSLYSQAQELLEKELGLDTLVLENPKSYETSFSEVVNGGRIDAEYYNPHTISLVNTTKEFNGIKLGESFVVGNGYPWKSSEFKVSNNGFPVVRIRDIRPGIIKNNEISSLSKKYAESQSAPKAKNSDIVIGMDGIKYFYAGLIVDECYVNQRVAHITPKTTAKVSSEYLMFIINEKIGQAQLLREMTIANTVGHITNSSIRNLLIPFPSQEIHDQITQFIKGSISAKKESEQLLAQAKKQVEDLIEGAVQ